MIKLNLKLLHLNLNLGNEIKGLKDCIPGEDRKWENRLIHDGGELSGKKWSRRGLQEEG